MIEQPKQTERWKILFSYENLLPSDAADAEVVLSTAGALAGRGHDATLSVPAPPGTTETFGEEMLRYYGIRTSLKITPVRSFTHNIAAQHVYHAAHFPEHPAFRGADFVYARNPIVVMQSLRSGQRVLMDHYRPWGKQFPPLQPVFRRFMGHPRFLGLVVHSDYSRQTYIRFGVPPDKLRVVHNGFDPQRMQPVLSKEEARALLDLPPSVRIVTYAGRINEKKGLEIILALARAMPDAFFMLVGSTGRGPIESEAESIKNVRIVPWQASTSIAPYLYASDVLTIPPSTTPLERVGNTVLPLKLFLYLAAGRAIFAGATPDTAEILTHDENAWLVTPGDASDAQHELRALLSDDIRLRRLGEASRDQAESLTWASRAAKIEAFIAERLDRGASASPIGPWSPASCALDTARWIGGGLTKGKWIYG